MKINQFLLIAGLFVLMIACKYESYHTFIAVNLAGYNTGQLKQALLVNSDGDEFEILRQDNSEVVFRGMIGAEKQPDIATGDRVAVLDFTGLEAEGEYVIRIIGSNVPLSDAFKITTDLYRELTTVSLQSFYYHRCGVKVKNDEPWGYEVCHTDDAGFYSDPGRKRDGTGGWHDAGDYNKFSVNTAFSVALLLYLYESNPGPFYDGQLSIPESANGIPDILDEAKWALQWLLKMQDSHGGIFHKVSQKQWTGEVLPNEDPETRYIFEISSTATADFAAVAAIGARVFDSYDPDFSRELAAASMNAWDYLEYYPVIQPLGGFKNPPDVYGGEYGDSSDTDERLWAAIELFKLSKEERFINYFIRHYDPIRTHGGLPVLSWKNVHSLAYYSFLSSRVPDKYLRIQNEVKEDLLRNADHILRKQERNNYMNLLSHTEYYWGSNSVGLGYAFELIQAYKLTAEEKYDRAALDQLHYVLGRNPFGISMVTGLGSQSVRNPYHQLSKLGGFKNPVPGMLVGGPNNHSHLRKYYRSMVISTYPGKNYEDQFHNYFVNEVAINFTAVFLYVAGNYVLDPPSNLSNI